MPVFDTYDDSGFISTLDVGVDPILEADFLRPQSPWNQRFAFGFVFDAWQTASETPQGTIEGPISFAQEAWGNALSAIFSGFPAQGNLLIAIGFNNNAAPTVNTAGGWVSIDSDNGVYGAGSAYKFCGASESKTQTPWTVTSSSTTISEWKSATGWPANPIDAHSVHESATLNPPAVGSPVIASTQPNDVFIFGAFQFVITVNVAPTSLPNFTTLQQLNSVTQTGPAGNGIVAYQFAPTLGGYYGICQWTGTTTKQAVAFGILIRPNPVQEFVKNVVSTQTASIAPAGSIQNFIAKILAAANMASSGVLNAVKSGSHFTQTLTASIASSGAIKNAIAVIRTASIASSGALQRAISSLRTASIASSGAIAKQTNRALAAILKFQLVDTIMDFTTGSAATATNISMTFPKGAPQPGDLLIAFMSVQGNTGSLPTVNSGWTPILLGHGNGPLQISALRVAGVSESATQTPFDNLTNQTGFGGMYRILNQGVTTVDASAYNGALGTGTLPFTLTPTSNYGLALAIISDTSNIGGAGQWTLPSGWTNEGFANGFQTNFSFAFNVPQGSNSLTFVSSNSTFNMSGMLINILGAAPLQRAISALKTAGISSSGALKRAIAKLQTATITSAGALTRAVAKFFTASIASSGALTSIKQKLVTFTASIASSGTLQRAISSLRTASIASTGAFARLTGWKRSASISSTGTEAKQTAKHQTATITSSGSMARLTKWFRTASEAASGVLTTIHSGGQEFFSTLTASIASSGTLIRATRKSFAASIASSGVLAGAATRLKAFTASISSSATMARSTLKNLAASITSSTTLGRAVHKGLSAVVTSAASLNRAVRKRISASMAPGGALSSGHNFVRALTATLSLAGAFSTSRIFHRIFTAVVSFVGSFTAFLTRKPQVAQFGVPMSNIAQASAFIGAVSQLGTLMESEAQVSVKLSAVAQLGTKMESEAQFAVVQGAP